VNADRIVTGRQSLQRSDMMLVRCTPAAICARTADAGSSAVVLLAEGRLFNSFRANGNATRSTPDKLFLAEVDSLTPRVGNRQGLLAALGPLPTVQVASAGNSARLALSGLPWLHTSTFNLTSVRGLHPPTVADDI